MQLLNISIIAISVNHPLRMKIPEQKFRPQSRYYSALQLKILKERAFIQRTIAITSHSHIKRRQPQRIFFNKAAL